MRWQSWKLPFTTSTEECVSERYVWCMSSTSLMSESPVEHSWIILRALHNMTEWAESGGKTVLGDMEINTKKPVDCMWLTVFMPPNSVMSSSFFASHFFQKTSFPFWNEFPLKELSQLLSLNYTLQLSKHFHTTIIYSRLCAPKNRVCISNCLTLEALLCFHTSGFNATSVRVVRTRI